ncbi:hypothetical protein NHX12_027840 [Muraenolepis orangiensis]|uniref:Reverse transcriptase domain-containing protein n=1 Tax=Muraenolepis orangiensis TaxID=630683 RepID=A0A9Q0EFE9_9TELE|nr:hypothetical protein NHX12_027840 [Muraenolepis orangiensis]
MKIPGSDSAGQQRPAAGAREEGPVGGGTGGDTGGSRRRGNRGSLRHTPAYDVWVPWCTLSLGSLMPLVHAPYQGCRLLLQERRGLPYIQPPPPVPPPVSSTLPPGTQGSIARYNARTPGAPSVEVDMSGQFTTAELRATIGNLRQGKSPGHDNIHPEFVTHQSETTSAWLCSFFSSCFQRSKLPKTWRRAAVIALLKPGKTGPGKTLRPTDPKAYRPISLLCVPFKILERMILSRIEPVVDPQLPREQAGFRRGRSTVDQVTLLTQDIEDSFQAKEKVGVVLLDLTAAYDTVWHRGLHLKLLRTIPDRHMVKFIMEMLSNRSFILRTSDGQRSRLRRLRNGVPQGSVLSPLLFNIYIHDLPETTSRQYGYADDLAIMLRRTTWSAVEQGLNQDMGILAAYLRKWRLQLSTGKTVSAAYHLCNREAKRELSVSVDNKRLEHQLAPKYLGVRLDRTLSYKQHLEEVRAKVTARVSLIRRLAGTTWGASARTLRISTQALVFSAAEYCAPVWSRSPHVKKVDPIINNALRIITGCLKPTPVSYLPKALGPIHLAAVTGGGSASPPW